MNSASLRFFPKSKSVSNGGDQAASSASTSGNQETTDDLGSAESDFRTKDNIDDGHCSNIEKSELTNGDVEGDDDFAPRIAEYKCSSRGCGP